MKHRSTLRTKMKLPIRHVNDGQHEFREVVAADAVGIENDRRFVDPVKIGILANRHLATMKCDVEIDTVARLECDRCLREIEKKMFLQPQLVIRFGPDVLETAEDDVVHVQADQLDYDLGPWIREHLMIELPMKILCREDCAGFCPGCGNNLNDQECRCETAATDPRWDKLKQLKDQ